LPICPRRYRRFELGNDGERTADEDMVREVKASADQ
jgi:hypothetical protein